MEPEKMCARKLSSDPDLLLESVEEMYKESVLPDLNIICQDGVVQSYRMLFGACSGLVQQCLKTEFDLEQSCIILPNIKVWELQAFHSTLLKFKCAPQNEELDAVLKVLTTLGVDIGQYLAVNLGPANTEIDINCLDLLTVDPKIENLGAEMKKEIILPASLEVIPVPVNKDKGKQTTDSLKAVKQVDYSCLLCGQTFKHAGHFEKHLSDHQTHQQQEEIGEEVSRCNEEDPGNDKMEDNTQTTTEEGQQDSVNNDTSSNLLYLCEKCNQTFTSAKRLREHAKVHEPREYACEVCKKSFKLRSTLTNHMKFHDDKEKARKFICDICKHPFSHPSNLKRHINTVHGDESEMRTFGCFICGKNFKDNGTLKFHIENHSETRRFACELCTKSYTRKSQLEAHYRVHTGEKPFECNICGKRFRLNGHLKSHKLSRHVGMKLKKSNLCPECGQGFVKEYDLRIHLRRHTGERPFTCDICKKSFVGERNFKDHARAHTGERPYECETCKKTFSSPSGIRQHFKANLNCRMHATEGAYSKFKQKRTEWQRLEGLSLSEFINTEATINLNEYSVEQVQDIPEDLKEAPRETIVYLSESELALVSGANIVQADMSGHVNIVEADMPGQVNIVEADMSRQVNIVEAGMSAGQSNLVEGDLSGQVRMSDQVNIVEVDMTSHVNVQAIPLHIEGESTAEVVLSEFLPRS